MESISSMRFLAVTVILCCGQLASAAAVRTVALTGQPAPGTALDFSIFSAPVINATGQTAFRASLPGTHFPSGIWSEGSGTLSLVALTGEAAPGMPSGVNYHRLSPPALNAAGQTSFYAEVSGSGITGANDHGIWSEGSGVLSLVVREGTRAPGADSRFKFSSEFVYDLFYSPALNAAGQTAFYAGLTGDGVDETNNEGLWSQRSGMLELVARKGSHAPGTPDGVHFNAFGYSSSHPPLLDGGGQTAFFAGLSGSGVDDTNNFGVWSERSGTLTLVAREGNQAFGMAGGINYAGFYSTSLNAKGGIAFGAQLTGSDDPIMNRGIWAERSGTLELVTKSRNHAPGTENGVNFEVLLSPVLNAAGQTAFVSTLIGTSVDGTNNSGVWSEGSGALELVARRGSHAPGTPNGVYFGSTQEFIYTPFSSPLLNAAGQVAFRGYLTGSGITDANDLGIWATDRSGVLKLIAREGDPLEVAPGDFRIISRLDLVTRSGNDDGQASGLSDSGRVAFGAVFVDGSQGVFVTLPPKAGDFNDDGDVDGRDFLVWQRGGSPSPLSAGDLAMWQDAISGNENFMAAHTAVPEPATGVLISLIAINVGFVNRRCS